MDAIAWPRGILFATLDSAWAGAQAQMLELAAALDRSAFVPVVLTTPRGGGELAERSRALGIATHVLPYVLLRRSFPFVPYYLAAPLVLDRLVRSERIGLVHAHDPSAALATMRAPAARRLPHLVHIHDLDQRWVSARTLALLARPNACMIGVSDAAARLVVARGVPASRALRVYNGVHLVAPDPSERLRHRRALGIGDDEIAVALVARFVDRKGQLDAVRAFATEALADERVRLYLVGSAMPRDREYEDAVRAEVRAAALDARVVFVGHREDAPSLLQAFDVSVLPARREAFGRTVVESMSVGVAVIGYDEAGIAEIVRDGVDGLLVPSGDIDALARAIARLAHDPALRARLAAAGRIRARSFAHERYVEEMSKLYTRMMSDAMEDL